MTVRPASTSTAVPDDVVLLDDDGTPRGTGLGQKLIRAMAQSLQAEFGYDPAYRGVRATLRAALT